MKLPTTMNWILFAAPIQAIISTLLCFVLLALNQCRFEPNFAATMFHWVPQDVATAQSIAIYSAPEITNLIVIIELLAFALSTILFSVLYQSKSNLVLVGTTIEAYFLYQILVILMTDRIPLLEHIMVDMRYTLGIAYLWWVGLPIGLLSAFWFSRRSKIFFKRAH